MPFRSSWFLWVLIYFEAVLLPKVLLSQTQHALGTGFYSHSQKVLVTGSARKSSPSYSSAMPNWGMSLPKDSCLAHWWALTFFFSINVKWLFVTLMINYQYWHRDYIWLHFGWRFKNRLKNWGVQLLSSIFMRWNTASENSELNWSQCLADFCSFFFSELLVCDCDPEKLKLSFQLLKHIDPERNSPLPQSHMCIPDPE